jgi:hypothetical protein
MLRWWVVIIEHKEGGKGGRKEMEEQKAGKKVGGQCKQVTGTQKERTGQDNSHLSYTN